MLPYQKSIANLDFPSKNVFIHNRNDIFQVFLTKQSNNYYFNESELYFQRLKIYFLRFFL